MEKNNLSDAKFRTITFAVTTVLCVAIIVVGVVYVAKLRERSNAGYSEQQTSETTTAETTTTVTTTLPETTTSETTTTAVETMKAPEITTTPETTVETTTTTTGFNLDTMTIDDIGIKAKSSEDGCIFRWKCTEDAMKKCLISFEITDGRSDYQSAGKVQLSAKHFEVTTGIAADAISARITVSKKDGAIIFVKTIPIENNTYVETTSRGEVDISSLFA